MLKLIYWCTRCSCIKMAADIFVKHHMESLCGRAFTLFCIAALSELHLNPTLCLNKLNGQKHMKRIPVNRYMINTTDSQLFLWPGSADLTVYGWCLKCETAAWTLTSEFHFEYLHFLLKYILCCNLDFAFTIRWAKARSKVQCTLVILKLEFNSLWTFLYSCVMHPFMC